MKKIVTIVLISIILLSCREKKSLILKKIVVADTVTEFNIIPKPLKENISTGLFYIDSTTQIASSGLDTLAGILNKYVKQIAKYNLDESTKNANIIFVVDEALDSLKNEGYRLETNNGKLYIKAKNVAGIHYGVRTLGQILSDSRFYNSDDKAWYLPEILIEDYPAFKYRGLMLDVSRHFFSVDFLKKYIDALAEYKINRFHWHLTDAGGWRLYIDKYPELTRIGAWRTQSDWQKWWIDNDRKFMKEGDENAYGGYYTKQEAREIVRYAQERGITVIPEIEMPGHSEEVFAAYPNLNCYNRAYRNGGVFCAGNEDTFEFLENVLDEVIDIFPSEYIHIGGDEVDKSHWLKCPKCKKLMQNKGFKTGDEIQSYFIKRISKYLETKGRKIIGWDEILEGGLAKGATVMSWRGEAGGIKAAKTKHNVVMTPGTHCYFDHYQDTPSTQPFAIGGFTPYLKVYSYYPIPDVLDSISSKYILGGQANVWTEYIKTDRHLEYMTFPRILALAEVLWTPKNKKDEKSFKHRVKKNIKYLHNKGINSANQSERIDIETKLGEDKKSIILSMHSEIYNPIIRYTLDGSKPDTNSMIYTKPIIIKGGVIVAARIDYGNRLGDRISRRNVDAHKAIGKAVKYNTMYSGAYPAAAKKTLTDGEVGGLSYSDAKWQGFLRNIDVVIDMGKIDTIKSVSARFMQIIGPGVYMPEYVKVYVSTDGKKFKEFGLDKNDISKKEATLVFKRFEVKGNERARYIRFFAKKYSGFQFIDEIIVY